MSLPSFPIERYLSARTAVAPSASSDGRWLAFLTDITGAPQIWRVPFEDASHWPEQLTFGTERVMGFRYSPAEGDGRLVFARDAGGNENAQLFLLDHDGTERCLTVEDGEPIGSAMHTMQDWSPDGRILLFSSNRRDPALFDLYLQDLESDGPARLVWENDARGFIGSGRLHPSLDRALGVLGVSSFENRPFEVNLADGTTQFLSLGAEPARCSQIRYTAEDRSLYLTTDAGGDFQTIQRLDRETGALDRLVDEPHDVDWMTLSQDGALLAFGLNADGASRVELLETSTGARTVVPLPYGDDTLCGQAAFSADANHLLYSAASAARTSDIHVWSRATGRTRQVTFSGHGGIPVSIFVSPRLITYATFDDREIPAWYYPAEGDAPAPAVVIVHGGPEGQSRPSFQGWIQYLHRSGYAVLVPNVRGSTGYGRTYADLDNVRKRMDSVADLAHGAEWLKRQPEVDGDRLVVYGGSYGGFMVLSALTTYPDLWAAGVDLVGISNFVTFLKNTSGYRREHRAAKYGTLEDDEEFLREISPMTHVDRIGVPMMVIHGRNDPRVPLSEAEQLVEAVRENGVEVTFIVFDDEGHGISKLKNRVTAYEAIAAFLDEHLMQQR